MTAVPSTFGLTHHLLKITGGPFVYKLTNVDLFSKHTNSNLISINSNHELPDQKFLFDVNGPLHVSINFILCYKKSGNN